MEEPLKLLENQNQEANENRIKLAALKAAYVNLANTYHQIMTINSHGYHNGRNFKVCDSEACKGNYEVLARLGLA